VARKYLVFFVSLCLLLTAVAVYQAPAETLDEYKERMKKEQEEAEKKKEEEKRKAEQEQKPKPPDAGSCFGSCLSGFCQAAGTGCFDAFFQGFIAIFSEVRYADYPFAPDAGFDFSALPRPDMTEEAKTALGGKVWMIEAGAWGSYLFGQNEPVFDAGGMLNVDLLAFHLNLYYQRLMSLSGTTLDTFSADAGFSLPVGNFILSLFAGAVWQEWSPWYFSFGTSGRVFVPGGVVVGWYALFAFYEPFFLIIVSPDVELALGRFTVGLGFNYYNYNNYVNFGPSLKAAIWL
jgi:hypothetical protein